MDEARSLAGKTLLVTGGSRGIGKAIGLRAARDGANVIIAAKTTTEHPKLPGTIDSAAAEIEAAGGRALAVKTDIRHEGQVAAAVAAGVQEFGGLDIVVNNASAISLTGTLETPLKMYDRMFDINARGSWLVTQQALPHLLEAGNPHVLNLSPPLNLNPKWLVRHSAYTLAKYAMSVCDRGGAQSAGRRGSDRRLPHARDPGRRRLGDPHAGFSNLLRELLHR